jgi:two-component system response regulator PilR (NtrC family)
VIELRCRPARDPGGRAELADAILADEREAAPPVITHASHRTARVTEDGIPESLPDYLDQIEREAIVRALEKTRYNRTAAARLLGITFRALRYRMQRLEIN